MRYIEIERTSVSALPGSNINNCIIECISYSIEHMANLSLNHNGRIFHINYNDIIGIAKEQNK